MHTICHPKPASIRTHLFSGLLVTDRLARSRWPVESIAMDGGRCCCSHRLVWRSAWLSWLCTTTARSVRQQSTQSKRLIGPWIYLLSFRVVARPRVHLTDCVWSVAVWLIARSFFGWLLSDLYLDRSLGGCLWLRTGGGSLLPLRQWSIQRSFFEWCLCL